MAVLTSESDVEPFLNRETVESDLLKLSKNELLLISDGRQKNIINRILLGFSAKDEKNSENGSLLKQQLTVKKVV